MKSKLKHFVWTEKEDRIIQKMVQNTGKRWRQISKQFLRITGFFKTGRQCRQRWYNHIDPNISRKQWTQAQEDIIFKQHQILGNKWSKIAEKLQGRSDNAVKNHFYSILRKILRRINKLLGTKNGTAKVRKIKSSALARLFSLSQIRVAQLSRGQIVQQIQQQKQQKKKQLFYRLINFSRYKISDRNQINPQETQVLQLLLQQIDKLNQEYQLKIQQRIKMKKTTSLYQDQDSNQIQSQLDENKNSNQHSQQSKERNRIQKGLCSEVKIQQNKENILKVISQININNQIDEKNIQSIPSISQQHKNQSPLKIQSHYPTRVFNQSSDKIIMNSHSSQLKDRDAMLDEDHRFKAKLDQMKSQIKKQVLNEVLLSLSQYSMIAPGNFIIMPGSNFYFPSFFNEMLQSYNKKNEDKI